MEDLYATLGVGRQATAEEIRHAYLARIRLAHPDLNPSGEEQAKRLNVAYETLSDPQRRRQYDDSLAGDRCPFCGMQLREGEAAEVHVMRHFAEMAATGCRVCGRTPADEVSYRANAGFILWRQVYGFEGPLCRVCGKGMFREFQARNIVRGPWGFVSIIAAAWYLLRNAAVYLGHRQGLDKPYPPDEVADRVLRGRPLLFRPGVLVIVGLVAAISISAAVSDSDSGSTSTRPGTNTPATTQVTYTLPDTLSWRVGVCVHFSGDRVQPVSCSSTSQVDGRVVQVTYSSSACPASADWYVTLDNSSVACISSA